MTPVWLLSFCQPRTTEVWQRLPLSLFLPPETCICSPHTTLPAAEADVRALLFSQTEREIERERSRKVRIFTHLCKLLFRWVVIYILCYFFYFWHSWNVEMSAHPLLVYRPCCVQCKESFFISFFLQQCRLWEFRLINTVWQMMMNGCTDLFGIQHGSV